MAAPCGTPNILLEWSDVARGKPAADKGRLTKGTPDICQGRRANSQQDSTSANSTDHMEDGSGTKTKGGAATTGRQFLKTRLCARGEYCKRKDKCNYAHSPHELRSSVVLNKTRLCNHFDSTGYCEDGGNCLFAHGLQEIVSTKSYFKTKLCQRRAHCQKQAYCRNYHTIGEKLFLEKLVSCKHLVTDKNDAFSHDVYAKFFMEYFDEVRDTWRPSLDLRDPSGPPPGLPGEDRPSSVANVKGITVATQTCLQMPFNYSNSWESTPNGMPKFCHQGSFPMIPHWGDYGAPPTLKSYSMTSEQTSSPRVLQGQPQSLSSGIRSDFDIYPSASGGDIGLKQEGDHSLMSPRDSLGNLQQSLPTQYSTSFEESRIPSYPVYQKLDSQYWMGGPKGGIPQHSFGFQPQRQFSNECLYERPNSFTG